MPAEVERSILQRLANISPIRALATVRTISAGTYRAAFSATGWVGETASRPETASQVLSELVLPAMELYAMPSATQTFLDDALVDVDRWIADEVEMVFAEQESIAFISGNGMTEPRGVLTAPVVADASWTWGNIGVLNSGAAGAFAAANPSDVLIALIYALRTAYRQNGTFMMNRRTQSAIRGFKDSAGNYIWKPPTGIGQPATLMNFPVAEAEAMPNIAANSVSVLFGDFSHGYLIVDSAGVSILRDPYSAKPYVLFYTTTLVGGGVQDFAAIKGLALRRMRQATSVVAVGPHPWLDSAGRRLRRTLLPAATATPRLRTAIGHGRQRAGRAADPARMVGDGCDGGEATADAPHPLNGRAARPAHDADELARTGVAAHDRPA